VGEEFARYGLELVDFFVNAITPPEEVQKAIDTRSAMGAVGDLNAFLKFQTANSMAKLAEAGGGAGGAMGMGLGAGFGMMMPGMIQQAMAGVGPQTGAPPAATGPAVGAAAAGVAGPPPVGPDFSGLTPPPPLSSSPPPLSSSPSASLADPKNVVRAVAIAAGYVVADAPSGLEITVPVGPLRKQKVHVEFAKPDSPSPGSVVFWSVCGPATEKNASLLLRYNAQTVHGAFAIRELGGREMVVLQAGQLPETLNPVEISRTLSAIAWQADQVEQKLVGEDTY